MQGSVDVAVGYGEYYVAPTVLAYSGADGENDSSPATDWLECQNNAKAMHDADTTLSAVSYTYGGSELNAIEHVIYDSYGSRVAWERQGWRIQFTVSNAWKSNGNIFKLAIAGHRMKWYNTGSPTWTNGGSWDDFGRLYFRYSENANLFSSGGNLVSTFGDDDFYIDVTQFNNACKLLGRSPWTCAGNEYIYITLDKNYISNMVGNDLYLWMYAPYYVYPFYHPYDACTVNWKLYPYRLYTYY